MYIERVIGLGSDTRPHQASPSQRNYTVRDGVLWQWDVIGHHSSCTANRHTKLGKEPVLK